MEKQRVDMHKQIDGLLVQVAHLTESSNAHENESRRLSVVVDNLKRGNKGLREAIDDYLLTENRADLNRALSK